MQVARLSKTYFGAPVDDDVHAALVAAGLVQPMDVDADQLKTPSLLAGGLSSGNGLDILPHETGYYGVHLPENGPISSNGVPTAFAAGDPVDYSRPPVNPTLNDAAALEGQKFRNSLAGPRIEEISLSPGVTLPGMMRTVQKPDYDLRNGLLESGINVDRNAFVQAHDAQQRAQDAQEVLNMDGEALPMDTRLSAFMPRSQSEQNDRNKAISDFARDALMTAVAPEYGALLSAKGAYESGQNAYDAAVGGDFRNSLLGAGGMALNLLGVAPGMKLARGYAEEAAAAGQPRFKLNPDGSYATMVTEEPGGWRAEKLITETPGTRLNALAPLFGEPRAQALQAAKEGMPNTQMQKELGAVVGPDGVPRREIPDSGLPVNFDALKRGETTTLPEVLPGHDELFDAVPQARNTLVRGTAHNPSYNEATDTISAIGQGSKGFGVDKAHVTKKLLENVQTAIQGYGNMAGAARHQGNFDQLQRVADAAKALRGQVAPEDIPALASYISYLENYVGKGRNALNTGMLNIFPHVDPGLRGVPGSPANIGPIDSALERASAGKLEKQIVGARAIQPRNSLPFVYSGGQVRSPVPVQSSLVLPTELNAADPQKLMEFIRNWNAIR